MTGREGCVYNRVEYDRQLTARQGPRGVYGYHGKEEEFCAHTGSSILESPGRGGDRQRRQPERSPRGSSPWSPDPTAVERPPSRKLVAGLMAPTAGTILLDGEDITAMDITGRAKKGIAYAFQQPVRFKGVTVRDLLEIAAGRPWARRSCAACWARWGCAPGLCGPPGGRQPLRRREQAH